MPPIPKRKFGSHAMFGGQHYTKPLDEWQVSWESVGLHRLWCYQARKDAKHTICVVMFNPGSLSEDGKNLRKDATLRFVRNAMPDTAASLVLNLFTRATPDPKELLQVWDERDCDGFNISVFQSKTIDALVYAYGDIGQDDPKNPERKQVIRDRITEIEEVLRAFPRLALPEILVTKRLKNPKHPKHWNLKSQFPFLKAELARLLDAA